MLQVRTKFMTLPLKDIKYNLCILLSRVNPRVFIIPHACCRHIVSLGFLGPLCDMLTVQTPKVVTVVLEALENILKAGKLYQDKYHGVNPFAFEVEEVNGTYLSVCGA